MKRILIIFLFFILCADFSTAQQDGQFSQYMFNSLYYNPGYAGIEPLTRFTLISRKQWLAYRPTQGGGGSPLSNILSVSTLTPFLNRKLGAGAFIYTDNLGPLSIFQFNLTGSYHLKLGNGILGIGLRAGLLSQKTKAGEYRVVDTGDPVYVSLSSGTQSQVKPDFSTGLWYKTSKYYAGLSVSHINSPKYNFQNSIIESKINDHIYFTGGYNFNYGSMIVITPTILVQTDVNQMTYLFGPMVTYNEKYWIGLNARQSFAKKDISKTTGKSLSNDDIILYLGVNLLKNKQNNNALRIGYSIDFVTSGKAAKTQTSHEIMLSYLIPSPWDAIKPKVRTPRYRHDEN